MKKFISIATMLLFITFLPLGVMADEDESSIPNHTITQDSTDTIPNLADDTEGEDLTPVERVIITRDAIRSNVSTGINSGN